jgi:hypothetical protein
MSIAASSLQIPADVQAFADQRGLGPYLPSLTESLLRLFADATVSVELHHDPEVESLSWILFETETSGWTVEEVRQAEKAWRFCLNTTCPASLSPLVSLVVYQGA